jgi:LysR family transcriptional regulator, nod-box dependent transcriptional activator
MVRVLDPASPSPPFRLSNPMTLTRKNLRSFNLNALPALREILKYGSLTKAAAALNLTQPALSNMLRQLRLDFEDDLIVRVGRSMELTQKGSELLAPLEATLQSIEHLLLDNDFDPAVSDRRFQIASNDHIMMMLGAQLAALMQREAPMMTAQINIAKFASIKQLLTGEIDMIITPRSLMSLGPSGDTAIEMVNVDTLFSEEMVCIGGLADKTLNADLSIEAYLARPHVGFDFGDGNLGSIEQMHLARLGYQQRNLVLVSSYWAIPAMVAASNCLGLVPANIAHQAKGLFPIQVVKSPIAMPKIEWVMTSHKRNAQDPFSLWLRSSVRASLTPLERDDIGA